MAEELRLNLAADEPQDLDAGRDHFGHGEYAAVLQRAVECAPPRFTIGLFGEWGLGKTTILRAFKKRLAPSPEDKPQNQVVFVEFDAWRYEHDALRRELLRVVAHELEHRKVLDGRYKPARELRGLDQEVSSKHETGTSFSLSSLLVFGLAVAVIGLVLLATGLFTSSKDVPLTLLVLVPLLTFLFVRFERIFVTREESVSHKRLEDPDRFARVFRDLVEHFIGAGLVIAVDNLDRCDAETVGRVLGTIKTYLEPDLRRYAETRKVVFVIAVDDEALRTHLMALAPRRAGDSDEDHARRARTYADEYLRKFFNATLKVHPLRGGDTSRYFRDELKRLVRPRPEVVDPALGPIPSDDVQLTQVEHMAMAALRRNPRRIRQFVNTLQLWMALIGEREDAGTIAPAISAHFAMVAKLALISEEWPERYDELRRDEARLAEWRVAAFRPPEEMAEAEQAGELGTDWPRFAAL